MRSPLRVFVVPHTHWDREWYHTAGRFRQRLVALVDALLDNPGSGPFLLDGQAVVLQDYLAVRPEQQGRLQQALAGQRLEAGPWFVLADNLIPSGEAITRNLAAGRRLLDRLGGSSPPVAYCPDSFGHPAAMPFIAQQFGLTIAVAWRGLGGATHPTTDLVRWLAPNGAGVVLHHLPPDGYEYGSALPTDPARARARWEQLAAIYRARNASGVVLLLNGADHHARQPDLPQALAALQQAAGETAHLEHTTLTVWAQAVSRVVDAARLPVVQGELRDSYGYTWTLAGTYATRAAQKRRNARLERGLLRDVEPWLALARLHATSPHALRAVNPAAQLSHVQLAPLLHQAWEALLLTHPHDTLCGCSIDAVARAMDTQQEQVALQGVGLREAALQLLLQHDPVSARARATEFAWQRLVLRNRAPRARGGVAHVTLVETLDDVPVGPASADSRTPVNDADRTQPGGAPVPGAVAPVWQSLSERVVHHRRESPQHYPDNDRVREHRGLLWVPPVPAYGLDVWDRERWHTTREAPSFPVICERTGAITRIRNGRITLDVHDAQQGALTFRVDDRVLPDPLTLEVQHDAGDSYTPSLRGAPVPLRRTRVQVIATGPLRAVVRCWWTHGSRAKDAGPDGRLRVVTDLVVDAMSPVLQCHVRGHSRRTDHRLQLVWRTDVHDQSGARVWADAAFGPVERPPITAPPHARESVPATMPMHRWVMQASPLFGATMIADGLAEAEVASGRLALTLVRAVGELSRHDLPERPGHAGWPAPTPQAQSLGSFAARTALFLHGPMSDDVLARVRDACDDVLLPLVGESWRDLDATRGPVQGLELVGEALELSAFTVSAHDADAVIVRVVNTSARSAVGMLRFPHAGPWRVQSCRLDETPLAEPADVTDGYAFEIGPRDVRSWRLSRSPT